MHANSSKQHFNERGYCNYQSAHPPTQVSHYWEDLHNDRYVDAGYRQRRFGVVNYSQGTVQGFVDEPHYQSTQNNKVYGGIQRQFSAIEEAFILSEFTRRVVDECIQLIDQPGQDWRIEMHQFRICTPGNPTPEGVHHDGAEFVLSMLIDRNNVTGGTMMVYDDRETLLFEHTMETAGECIFLNDRRVMHGVTNVTSRTGGSGHRDVLVMAFFTPG